MVDEDGTNMNKPLTLVMSLATFAADRNAAGQL